MSALVAEFPLSPELVLVSPPEVASVARALLFDAEPPSRPPAAAPRARTASPGAAVFAALCVANSLTPLVLAALAAA